MNKKEQKIKRRGTRQLFLSTFFPQETDHYEVKEVNGFILVKQYNRPIDKWDIAIYTKESYKNSMDYLSSKKQQTSLLDVSDQLDRYPR
jgi:uncharacterized protein YjfI (DUF2170 family)